MKKLNEEQLKNIVFDLGAARKGELNESILHVFAALERNSTLRTTQTGQRD